MSLCLLASRLINIWIQKPSGCCFFLSLSFDLCTMFSANKIKIVIYFVAISGKTSWFISNNFAVNHHGKTNQISVYYIRVSKSQRCAVSVLWNSRTTVSIELDSEGWSMKIRRTLNFISEKSLLNRFCLVVFMFLG